MRMAWGAIMLVACGGTADPLTKHRKEEACEAMAEDIRTTAVHHRWRPQFICSQDVPEVQAVLGEKCRALSQCYAELAAMD